jgi:hypothetical protein
MNFLMPFPSLYAPQALSIKGLQRIEQKKFAPRTTARAAGSTRPCEGPPIRSARAFAGGISSRLQA